MTLNKFIQFLIVISIVIGCKKQPTPTPEYILERDNTSGNTNSTVNTLTVVVPDLPSKIIYALPVTTACSNDSIYGNIICNRPSKGRAVNKYSAFINLTEAEIPLNIDHTGLNAHNLKDYNVYNNPNDSDLVIFEFIYRNQLYKVYSSRGFSNCIFDSKVYNYNKHSGKIPYSIKYDGLMKNTHVIGTCGPVIHLEDTLAILETCTQIANFSKEERRYSISFINYECFIIEGRKFIIHKYATHNFSFY